MDSPPHAGELEFSEIIVYGTPGWIVMREHSPRTSRSNNMEDGIENMPHVDGSTPASCHSFPGCTVQYRQDWYDEASPRVVTYMRFG